MEHNLLWTGGWDSTFRLLYLLIIKRVDVQPYYFIDTRRKSFPHEIRTIHDFKILISHRNPFSEALLNSTIYVDVDDVPPDRDISGKHGSIRSEFNIAIQYEYICRFVAASGITDMELSIIRQDYTKSERQFFSNILMPYLMWNEEGEYYRLHQNSIPENYDIFRGFAFPLLPFTKLETRAMAEKYGFLDTLSRTWFCLKPIANKYQCGICNPCRFAMQDGFGHRIPRPGRILYHLSSLIGKRKFQ